MVFGAIIGSVVGSVLQNRANEKAMAAQESSIEQAMELLRQGQTAATPFLENAIKTYQAAKQEALGYTAQAEFQGYRALGDIYKQGSAALNQSLASRGLYNSTAALAQQRGVASQYARDVGQFGAQLAGARSSITMQAAQGVAGGQQALGSLAANTYGRMAQIRGNVQYQAPQGIAESWGALGGAFDSWSSWASGKRKPYKPTGRGGTPTSQTFGSNHVGF